MNDEKIAIFIINYNGLTLLGEIFFNCLEQFVNISKKYSSIDLWLVDNGSSDASVVEVKKLYGDSFKYITSSRNLGYGASCNIAYRYTKMLGLEYKYYICSNNDIIVDPDAFGKILATLVDLEKKYPSGFIATPLLQNGYDNFVDFGGYFLDSAGNAWPLRLLFLNIEKVEKILKGPIKVSYADGAFLIIHKNVIKDIGLFSNHFILYYEDVELSLRGWNKKYPSIFIPIILGKHYRSSTSKQLKMEVNYLSIRNKVYSVIHYLGLLSFLKYVLWQIFYPIRLIEIMSNKQLFDTITKISPHLTTLKFDKKSLVDISKYIVRAFFDGIKMAKDREKRMKIQNLPYLNLGFTDIVSQKRTIIKLRKQLKKYILSHLHA